MWKLDSYLHNPLRTPPPGFDTFEKFEYKSEALREALVLEIKERWDVDDVINFFADIKDKNEPKNINSNYMQIYQQKEIPTGMSLADIIFRHKMKQITQT